MTVALQLRPEAAQLLREELSSPQHSTPPARADEAALRRMLALVRDARASVTPVHPRATDPLLSNLFTLDVPDPQHAADLAAALLNLPIVEAAYVKPSDEPPA